MIAAAQQKRWKDAHRELMREKNRNYYYAHVDTMQKQHREYGRTHSSKRKSRDPIKARAADVFEYALRLGKIVRQPCEVCGDLKSEGHHPDYSKPLEVIWLCRSHHTERHRKYA